MSPSRQEDIAAIGLLVAATLTAFWPALQLPFRNADDFLHLEVAWALLGGEPGALGAMVRGYGDSDALRLVPWAAWVLDTARAGFSAGAFYGTNVALQVAIALGVYALARRLGAGPSGALVGGAWVGLNVATGQGLYFLGARDDQCAALLVVVAVAAWPRGCGRWWGPALLAMACLTKPPAAVVLLLAVWVDRVVTPDWTWRRARGPAVVGALYVLALVLVVKVPSLQELLWSEPQAGRWSDPELARRAGALIAPGWSVRLPGRTLAGQAAPALMAACCGGLALWRGGGGRAARTGLLWLALTAPVPLLWLSSRLDSGEDSGRLWLTCSAGVGLLLAAAVPTDRRVGWPVAAVLGLAILLRFTGNAEPFLAREDPTVERFVLAVQEAEGPLTVALQRPHAGLSALFTSGVLRRVAGLEEPPRVRLQGQESGSGVAWEPLGYGSMEGSWAARAGDDEWVDGAAAEPKFEAMPAGYTGVPGPRTTGWRFEATSSGWSTWPPRARSVEHDLGRGFVVRGEATMHEGQVGVLLRDGARPTALISPELALDPHAVCGLRLDVRGRPEPPGWRPMGAQLVEGGLFSIVTWSEGADFADGFQRSVVVPLGAEVRLDLAPAWRASDWVRRLAVVPVNVPGTVELRRVDLLGCEAPEG